MPSVAELEKQIYDLKLELQQARKDNPPEKVENYAFASNRGATTLGDLFGDKEYLFLIHNMGDHCNYCTLWADSLNHVLPWIRTKAEVALCNRDELAAQALTQSSRGWNYQVVQDPDGRFTAEMGYSRYSEKDGKTYLGPGVSAFRKNADGSIERLNHTQFGPGDDFCPVWPMWDLIGGSDWEPS